MTLNWEVQELQEHGSRWKLTELASIIGDFETAFCNKIQGQMKLENNYQNILFWIAGKSIVTLREIICLSQYGYPDGVLTLARNIYEQFITIVFFELHFESEDFNQYVSDYFLDYAKRRNSGLQFELDHHGLPQNERDQLVQRKEAVKNNAHHSLRGNYWWTGKGSFENVVKYIIDEAKDSAIKNSISLLHLLYIRSSLSLHANSMGNMIRLGINPQYTGVDTSPQTDGFGYGLYLATSSFSVIVGSICKRFNLDYSLFEMKLKELCDYYFNSIKEEVDHA